MALIGATKIRHALIFDIRTICGQWVIALALSWVTWLGWNGACIVQSQYARDSDTILRGPYDTARASISSQYAQRPD